MAFIFKIIPKNRSERTDRDTTKVSSFRKNLRSISATKSFVSIRQFIKKRLNGSDLNIPSMHPGVECPAESLHTENYILASGSGMCLRNDSASMLRVFEAGLSALNISNLSSGSSNLAETSLVSLTEAHEEPPRYPRNMNDEGTRPRIDSQHIHSNSGINIYGAMNPNNAVIYNAHTVVFTSGC